MGLFGGGGMLSKAAHKTEQITHDVWTHGGKEAVTVGGVAAATLLTGGAAAGALGFAETAAALTGTTAFLGGAALTAGAAYQGAKTASARQDAAEAQYAYDVEVSKAQEKERQNRRANLLSLRKNLTPPLSKTSQNGQTSADSDIKSTGGIILG